MEPRQPVAWMVYTQDGRSCYVTDNPADVSPHQRALPLYTGPFTTDESPLRAEVEALREVLEDIRSRSAMNLAMRPDPVALTAMLGNIHQIADAALSKENSDD